MIKWEAELFSLRDRRVIKLTISADTYIEALDKAINTRRAAGLTDWAVYRVKAKRQIIKLK